MKCNKCGFDIKEGAQECEMCGFPVMEEAEEEPILSMRFERDDDLEEDANAPELLENPDFATGQPALEIVSDNEIATPEKVKQSSQALGESPLEAPDQNNDDSSDELKKVLQTIFTKAQPAEIPTEKPQLLTKKQDAQKTEEIQVVEPKIAEAEPAEVQELSKEQIIAAEKPMANENVESVITPVEKAAAKKPSQPPKPMKQTKKVPPLPKLDKQPELPLQNAIKDDDEWTAGDNFDAALSNKEETLTDIQAVVPDEKANEPKWEATFVKSSTEEIKSIETGSNIKQIAEPVKKQSKPKKDVDDIIAEELNKQGYNEWDDAYDTKEVHVTVAGFLRRAAAGFVDFCLVLILTGLFLFVGIKLFGQAELPDLGVGGFAYIISLGVNFTELIPCYLFVFIYIFVFMELMFSITTGQTPGKMIFKLKLIQSDGQAISLFRQIVRLLGVGFSTILFFLGFLWIIVDKEKQGLHDKLAQTYVIRVKD